MWPSPWYQVAFIGDMGTSMRGFAVLGLCVLGSLTGACNAWANTANLMCTRADGAGTFPFVVDYDTSIVTVGRFTAIPASIDPETITFNYFLGQIWGAKSGQHYFVTFDRASGLFVSHNDGGEYPNGKRWLEMDASSTCK